MFSLLHPCFSGPGAGMYAEERAVEGRSHREFGLKISHYRTPAAFRGEGVRGQPEPTLYFHRSLETLLGTAFRHGFRLDGLEEPGFAVANGACFEWQNMPDLAPVLVARMVPG